MALRLTRMLLVAAVVASPIYQASAQSIDQSISILATAIGKVLSAQGAKTVAAVDFTDLQSQPTELGRFLSDQLTIELVSQALVSVVDRANIKAILAENRLTEAGLVNPANAKKLGQFAGVDAILFGNVTPLDNGVVIAVRAVSTQTARILAAGKATIAKSVEIQQLLNRSIATSSIQPQGSRQSAVGSAPVTYTEAPAIATRDVGPLRVTLRSVLPRRGERYGRPRLGLRTTYDVTSLETQRIVFVGLNAVGNQQHSIGDDLRSSASDDAGGIWALRTVDAKGIGTIGVGHSSWQHPFSPSEIVQLLTRRDERNSDINPSDNRLQIVFGSLTPIQPGQTVRVSLDFVLNERDRDAGERQPTFFVIDAELVIGLAAPDQRPQYAVRNLSFDRISMPRF